MCYLVLTITFPFGPAAMSTKVITAAVVGSTVCGLLLVAALSCTCKLYQLYHSDPHPPTHTSPLREIEDELMRREAPPSYTATMSSPHFDEAQRAFIESLQAAAQARQESRSRDSNRSSQRSASSSSRNLSSVSGQVSSSENPPSPPSTENTTQNTSFATSSFQTSATNQQNQVAPVAGSPPLVDDSSSPYTEITDIAPPSQGEDTSCYTTDTDSDTNAEAEQEQRDQVIIRAAKNIRRMRLAGGIQTIVDSVTNRQREDALQQSGQDESRRRSSSGLQSVMERISHSRENHNRQNTSHDSDHTTEGNSSTNLPGAASASVDSPHIPSQGNVSPEQQNSLNHNAVLSQDDTDDGQTVQAESSQPSQSHVSENSSNSASIRKPSHLSTSHDEGHTEERRAPLSNPSPPSTPGTSSHTTDDDLPLDISESDHQYTTIVDDDEELLIPS